MKSILCTLVLCMFMGGGQISVFGKTVRPAAESGCSASPAGSEKISKQRARAYRKKLRPSARRHFVRRESSGTKPCGNGKWLCARPGSSVKRLCAKRVRNAGRTWTLPCESSEKSCKRQLQSRKGRYARPSGPGNGHGSVRKRPIGGGGRFFVDGNSRRVSSRTGRGWLCREPDKALYLKIPLLRGFLEWLSLCSGLSFYR